MPMLAVPIIAGGLAAGAASTAAAATTAGVITTGLTVAGAAGSAYSGYETAQYQAQVAKNNQALATANAQYTEQAGVAATQQQELKDASQMGAIRATIAANGLDTNSGSALDLQRSQAELGTLNVETTQANYQRDANNQMAQATNFGNEASVYDSKGDTAIASGAGNLAKSVIGGSSILGNSSSVSPSWLSAFGS